MGTIPVVLAAAGWITSETVIRSSASPIRIFPVFI
jgi:hypothetical protein